MSEPGSGTKWQPSPDQERLLSVFQAHEYDIFIGEACNEANINRQQYYRWHDIPEFAEWWQFQAERHFRLQLHAVHLATVKAATGGNLTGSSDRKLFLERFDRDYCPKGRSEVSGPNGGAIPMQIVMFGEPQADDTETDPGDPAAGI